jgi:hypothetical protein
MIDDEPSTIPQPDEDDDACEPGGCQPMRRLERRVGRLESSVRIMAASNVQLTQQQVDQTMQMKMMGTRIGMQDDRLAAIEVSIKSNTSMTEQIRDVVVTGRTMGQFLRYLAPTLVAIGISIGVVRGWAADIWHGVTSGWHNAKSK